MFRTTMIAAASIAVSFALTPAGHADSLGADVEISAHNEAAPTLDNVSGSQERLMIVSRNTGRIIYDDGRNDLFCATAVYVAGYTQWGRPIYRRSMRCR
jgi:hypothetical protein